MVARRPAPGIAARPARRRLTRWSRGGALAGAFVVGLLGFDGTGARTYAEEPAVPAAIEALDTESAAERAAALERLLEVEDLEIVVTECLWTQAIRRALPVRTLVTLCDLVRERRLKYANLGLRKLLKDGETPLAARKAAARALEVTGSIADATVLGDVLLELPEEASRALVAIDGPVALRALRRGAGENPPPSALAALARLGEESGLDGLVARLEAAEGADRERLAGLLEWATGRSLGDDAAAWRRHLTVRTLAAELADRDNEKATAAAARLVAVLRETPDAPLADDLITILRDPDWHVFSRDKAALILGLGGVRKAKDALLESTRNLEPGSVRLYSAEALARVGDLSIAVPFANMLVHDEDRDRLSAKRGATGEYFPVDPGLVRTLYRLGIKGGAGSIVELLAGQYRTRMHRDCLRALREVSGGEQFGFEPDSSQQARAARMLVIRDWWRANRERIALEPSADDPGWETFNRDVDGLVAKLGAFKFLHQLRAKNALIILAELAHPKLVAALDSDDLHVRMGASEVLAGAGLRASLPALVDHLPDEPKAPHRTKLLDAISACSGPRAEGTTEVPPELQDRIRTTVQSSLDDRSLDVRIAAAHALGRLADRSSIQKLQEARGEVRNGVTAFRVASAGALLALGDRSAVSDLLDELDTEEVAERDAAAKLLAAGGIDTSGYDADADPASRAEAIASLREIVSQEER